MGASRVPGPWVSMSEGVRRRVLAVGATMLTQEVEMEAGAVVAMHAHPHEQITYVVRGALSFQVGDRESRVEAGQALVIPSNVPHGCRATQPTLAYDVFHPVREDYVAELSRT